MNFFFFNRLVSFFFFFIGVVLKCALLKIAHDKYRTQKRQHNSLTEITDVFHSARQGNSEIAALVNSYTEILNPVRVLELFERIPTEVYSYLRQVNRRDFFFSS